jgi:two-component system phosphate regulon sensor histidine kinase PhoR
MAADLLGRGVPLSSVPELQDEAIRLGGLIGARVTFIAPDGRVVGDSGETLEGIATVENHGQRPEVIDARTSGIGRSRRYSTTVKFEMLYVAIPAIIRRSPSCGSRCRSRTFAISCRRY